jgi:hypothetical protein
MSESVFIKNAKLTAIRKEVEEVLAEVDSGKYDEELARAGIDRSKTEMLGSVKLSGKGQGLTPDEWVKIIAVFGPTVAVAAKDVWKIVVVPRLKRVFRADRVSTTDPKTKPTKKTKKK